MGFEGGQWALKQQDTSLVAGLATLSLSHSGPLVCIDWLGASDGKPEANAPNAD